MSVDYFVIFGNFFNHTACEQAHMPRKLGGFISRDVRKFEGNLNKNIRKYLEFQTTKKEIWISVVEALTTI